MKGAIDYLKARSQDEWLIGHASQEFTDRAWQRYRELIQQETPPTILLAERDPVQFLASLVAACAANCQIFLGNPDWVETEWQQVFARVKPNLIWGEPRLSTTGLINSGLPLSPLPNRTSPLIMIPTGGSSGKVRFAIHTWDTLMASVQGFRSYFEVDRVHSCCVLPLYHVSGLMQFLRSFTSGGSLVIQSFKTLEAGHFPALASSDFFLSLVPTQLHRLLNLIAAEARPRSRFTASSANPLRAFKAILLGGAPAWEDLLEQARSHHLPIAPTYGMTETAAQIVTLKPADFLAGKVGCGQVLPHAQVQILSPTGKMLPAGQVGRLAIQADSLMLGYYPDAGNEGDRLNSPIPQSRDDCFDPDDLGYLDSQGYLHIVGRSSQKIITGGENVFPAEVEAAIRATNLVQDVCVVGTPDHHWGEVVTAVYVPMSATVGEHRLLPALEPKLSKFKRPKYWVAVAALPRNGQGKINFAQLEQIISRNRV